MPEDLSAEFWSNMCQILDGCEFTDDEKRLIRLTIFYAYMQGYIQHEIEEDSDRVSKSPTVE